MNPNPFLALAHSRKALIATTNILASTITLLVGHYLDPASANFYIGLVAMWQPVVIMWIKTIADEDNSIRENSSAQSVTPQPTIVPAMTIPTGNK